MFLINNHDKRSDYVGAFLIGGDGSTRYNGVMKLPANRRTAFQKSVLEYYRARRRDFPWRKTRDPYAILVSEIMLQQTQAERVVPYFSNWMKQFPTVHVLAQAPVSKVLRVWQGLGYNRRALNLRRAGEMIVKEYRGAIPKDVQKIDALPGVGPYTAGAVGAFAFNISSVFIETNIRTVYLHFFFAGQVKVRDEEILALVRQTLPNRVRHLSRYVDEPCSVREWYNALMDYGAMLKETVGNPNIHGARYAKQSRFKGSRRELRGKVLRHASLHGSVSVSDFRNSPTEVDVAEIFTKLVAEGFLKKVGKTFTLAS